MNQNVITKAALVLTAAIFLLSGCSMFPEEEEALAPPLKQPVEVTYQTEAATRGTISQEISASCTVVAAEQYDLAFTERSGVLRTKEVAVGDTVKKGQVIATIDGSSAQSDLDNAKLELEMQKINLERALSKGNPDVDTNGNPTNYDARIAQLQIEQIELRIEQLEKEISATTLYAPIDGVVTYLAETNIGETVGNGTVICRVANDADLCFEYSGYGADELKLGMNVTITVDGTDYAATVTRTQDSVPDNMKNDYDGKVCFSASGIPGLKIGGKANFTAVVAVKENVVLVPRSAVTGTAGYYYVSVLEDGVKTERSVDIGIMSTSQVEILNGVSEGEEVIVG